MAINIQNVSLRISAGLPKQFPKDAIPQIAFSGRSNVGKSSLINTLLNRKNLARVSSMPGKTITINFYDIDKNPCNRIRFKIMARRIADHPRKIRKALSALQRDHIKIWPLVIKTFQSNAHELYQSSFPCQQFLLHPHAYEAIISIITYLCKRKVFSHIRATTASDMTIDNYRQSQRLHSQRTQKYRKQIHRHSHTRKSNQDIRHATTA